ncbi:uncharacterized protein LOC117785927 [Drosophila innubila]|uniref:uncharacterized protein LOC117785927 n=1 Tax=Drosophila innubila TaxID=198719 RepID=UPI00148DB0A5|nr:uncharacterized protein LOC117785927 [Drosophila innubila]
MVIKLLQLPVTNASLRVEVLRRGYTQSLYHFDIDCCQFIISKRRNPIAKAIYKFLRLDTNSNVNHSCPYNNDLIIDHLQFDKDLNLHLPIGKGEYVMKMYWKIYNVLRSIIDVNMQITD